MTNRIKGIVLLEILKVVLLKYIIPLILIYFCIDVIGDVDFIKRILKYVFIGIVLLIIERNFSFFIFLKPEEIENLKEIIKRLKNS